MLILARKPMPGKDRLQFAIGAVTFEVVVHSIDKNTVRLGIVAPPEVVVMRSELLTARREPSAA